MTILVYVMLFLGMVLGACVPTEIRRTHDLLRAGKFAAAAQRANVLLMQSPDCIALQALVLETQVASVGVKKAVDYYQRLSPHSPDGKLLTALAFAVLNRGLWDRRAEIRGRTVRLISPVSEPALKDALHRLLDDPDLLVRSWAALALGSDPQGLAVMRALLTGKNPQARGVAIQALGERSLLAPRMLRRLAADSSAVVRVSVAQVLGRLRPDLSLPILEQLARDMQKEVRLAAIRSLGAGQGGGVRRVLKGALNDAYVGVRLAAFQGLARIPQEWTQHELLVLMAGKDLLLALQAGRILAQRGQGYRFSSILVQALAHQQWPIRGAATVIASTSPLPDVQLLVIKTLKDPHPHVRLLAARAVIGKGRVQLGLAAAQQLHEIVCGDDGGASDASLCLYVAELLVQQKQAVGLRTLKHLIRHGSVTAWRIAAMAAYFRFRADSALALELIQDEDPQVGLHGALWLYRIAERPTLY